MTRINLDCLQKGVVPKFIDLSPHKDPDDFLREEGIVTFQKRMEDARAFVDVLIDRAIPDVIPDNLDNKFSILEKVYEICEPLGEDLQTIERVVQAAKRLNMQSSAEQIGGFYKEFLAKKKSQVRNVPDSFTQDEPPAYDESYFEMMQSPEFMEEMPNQIEDIQSELKLSQQVNIFIRDVIKNPEALEHKLIDQLLDLVGSNEVKTYILRLKDLFFDVDEAEFSNLGHAMISKADMSSDLKGILLDGLSLYRPDNVMDEKQLSKFLSDHKSKLEKDKLKNKKEFFKD